MPLTDTAIRNAKPGAKQYKLNDGRGLYLLIKPNGSRLWQMKYHFLKTEKLLSFGAYPGVTIAAARKARDQARLDLKNSIDPGAKRKIERAAAVVASANTFEAVAAEFIERKKTDGSSPATIKVYERILQKVAGPSLNKRPISDIRPVEILTLLKRLEDKGQTSTAQQARSMLSQVFRLAVVTLRAEMDPTAPLVGATQPPVRRAHPAITDPVEFGKLLKTIDSYTGWPTVKAALQIVSLTMLRSSELRRAEWKEIDLEAARWVIPVERMKTRQAHETPLSRQAVEVLRDLHKFSGKHRYVFSSKVNVNNCIVANTMNVALEVMGYPGNVHVAHGFRSSFSTLANEREMARWEVIEAQIAHVDPNETRRVYNRAQYWQERVSLAQDWADYCDSLKAAA